MVKKKHPQSSSYAGGNALLMTEIRGEWSDWIWGYVACYQNWTAEGWKNIAWSFSNLFQHDWVQHRLRFLLFISFIMHTGLFMLVYVLVDFFCICRGQKKSEHPQNEVLRNWIFMKLKPWREKVFNLEEKESSNIDRLQSLFKFKLIFDGWYLPSFLFYCV